MIDINQIFIDKHQISSSLYSTSHFWYYPR